MILELFILIIKINIFRGDLSYISAKKSSLIITHEFAGVKVTGENALQRYDKFAFDRIYESAMGASARNGRLEQLTFLRMGDLMFDNWTAFCYFINRMRSCPS